MVICWQFTTLVMLFVSLSVKILAKIRAQSVAFRIGCQIIRGAEFKGIYGSHCYQQVNPYT